MNGAALIETQAARLRADFALTPVVACEIEFYLPGGNEEALRLICARENISPFKIEKERGEGQYEIALPPAAPDKTATDIARLKTVLAQELHADFSAKPFADRPGSGLHVHLHLNEASGKNVFYKDDALISDALKFSIGGLLAWLPDSMTVFAPNEHSYMRFAAGDDHTPATISWGANNRTVAVRLPDAASDQKHIEHRVPCADADPYKVIAIILAATHEGIKNRIEPSAQMYGDASDAQYALPKLPFSLKEARERMQGSKMVRGYFSSLLESKDGLPWA